MLPALEWQMDPTQLALKAGRWRTDLPDAGCLELGKRLLLAQLEASEWVLRRVEKVAFERDRSVSRSVAVDLMVPLDAPVLVDEEGRRRFWLVPVSTMRRRTLVNLGITDEDGLSLTTLGLRLTQQMDQSVLLAAAEVAAPGCLQVPGNEIRHDVQKFVAGTRTEAAGAFARLEGYAPLGEDPLFLRTLRRMNHSWTLNVCLPVELGRHRLLRMSFEEPMEWRYQRPRFLTPDKGQDCAYKPGRRITRHEWSHVAAGFGLLPTRVRLQVPAAEATSSYHFEATAPHGVRIVEAGLLAGRPNDATHDPSLDRVVGHSPTVGLHAVEVPNGSSCRVQLDLAIPARGWLSTNVVSSWIVVLVLAALGIPWLRHDTAWPADRVTNMVLVLVTTSAGVATLIAQRDFAGVAARLVSRLRSTSVVVMTLPVVEAGLLVFVGDQKRSEQRAWERWTIVVLCAVALLLAVLVSAAWRMSWAAERRDVLHSPWDMTLDEEDLDRAERRRTRSPRQRPGSPFGPFWTALTERGFDVPALAIKSSEAWHESYTWTDEQQVRSLEALRSGPTSDDGPQTCAYDGRECVGACPTKRIT